MCLDLGEYPVYMHSAVRLNSGNITNSNAISPEHSKRKGGPIMHTFKLLIFTFLI